jgi:hypothetical protein
MHHDFASGILVIGAIGVLAGAFMAGRRLFGKKTQSVASTILWILVGLFGLASVLWILAWPHVSATAPYESASKSGISASGTSSPTNPTSGPNGPAPQSVPDSAVSAPGGTSHPEQPDLVLLATSAILYCAVPLEPTDIPDGASASIEQMHAVRTSVFAYDAATTVYIRCVDSTVNEVMRQYRGVASASNLQTLKTLGINLHNAAVDKDQALANRMNKQIRIFKAKRGS